MARLLRISRRRRRLLIVGKSGRRSFDGFGKCAERFFEHDLCRNGKKRSGNEFVTSHDNRKKYRLDFKGSNYCSSKKGGNQPVTSRFKIDESRNSQTSSYFECLILDVRDGTDLLMYKKVSSNNDSPFSRGHRSLILIRRIHYLEAF
uniref:Uncharacterized protein n=1 Tax=Romanomermis culicivorax TaxID=13658 RepID=A0A915IM89_ROMCU